MCQKSSGSWRDKGVLTLRHEVPPRRVQWIVRTPPADILTVGRTSVVLVYICGTKRCLPVEPWE